MGPVAFDAGGTSTIDLVLANPLSNVRSVQQVSKGVPFGRQWHRSFFSRLGLGCGANWHGKGPSHDQLLQVKGNGEVGPSHGTLPDRELGKASRMPHPGEYQ